VSGRMCIGKAVFGPDNSRQVTIAHGRSRFGPGRRELSGVIESGLEGNRELSGAMEGRKSDRAQGFKCR
jgi:hypothetical protein